MVPVSRHIFAINLHTQSDGRKLRDTPCTQLFNYACLSLFQCDTSGHFCHCLHLLRMCFLNCIAEVASLLCCEWISHLETANVTILLLKPFCSILIPKLFRKNNYSPCGSRTVHIAHTCICGRQALQFLLKDSSTSRSSLLS